MNSTIVIKIVREVCLLIVATLLVFLVFEFLPGDSAQMILGINAEKETVAALRTELGLDRIWYVRYVEWLGGFFTGNFGLSYSYQVPIISLIGQGLLVSVPLAGLSLLFTVGLGLLIGIGATVLISKPIKGICHIIMQMGIALPNFWLGMFFILFFAVYLHILPSGGFTENTGDVWEILRYLLLPALAIAIPQAAILARMTYGVLSETLRQNFIRTAQSKGLDKKRILWFHALPNAFIPLLTVISLQFSFLIAGTIVIENVFYLPGLGKLIYQSVIQRDFPVIKTTVVILIFFVMAVNLATKIVIVRLNPQIRHHHDA